MKLSQLIQEQQKFNSQSFKNLTPKLKEAVNDIFKLIEKEQGNVINKFESSIEKVSKFHNVNKEEIENFFDDEINEYLGEK